MGDSVLIEAQKQERVDYCLAMLKKVNGEGGRSKRVYDIITGDESCFYYYDAETKRQSQVWVAINNPFPTKVRRQRSLGNTYVCNFLYEVRF